MKVKAFIKKNISVGARVIFCIGALCGVIKLIAALSTPFADFFNRHISSIFRAIFAHISGVFPFSIAETAVICMIPCSILYLVWCFTVAAKKDKLTRQIFNLCGVIVFLLSTFVLNYGAGYDTTPLEDKMELTVTQPTTDDLYRACADTLIEMYPLEREITRDADGAARMPFSFDEMVDKLNDAYDTLYTEYDFLSPLHTGVKRIALSKALTYTHMSGFYTFWSGEANVNTNYPDYVIVYTTAHEMAHQRGIAPEDEANFVAFLACAASEDAYIRYCGYANLMEYLANALYAADPEMYTENILAFFPDGLRAEYAAYAAMFEPYRDSTASEVSGAVNDAYLKAQGQSAGTKSYGLVVDLAVAYYHKQNQD